jgi:membrane protein implicated in regulation of membrane protease activity
LSLEGDVDADVDADMDGHLGGIGDALSGWLPFASMRFWIFFLAFFGLTGTLLSTLGSVSSAVLAGTISGVRGYLCGLGTTKAIKKLQAAEIDSSIRETDYLGTQGRVVVPISGGELGKIRLELKGSIVEVLARTDDATDLGIGSPVIVYSTDEDGNAVVSQLDQLEG